jgi:hypothetical protein
VLVSITYVLVSIACLGEYNMCVGAHKICVSEYNMCVGAHKICVSEYNMCW